MPVSAGRRNSGRSSTVNLGDAGTNYGGTRLNLFRISAAPDRGHRAREIDEPSRGRPAGTDPALNPESGAGRAGIPLRLPHLRDPAAARRCHRRPDRRAAAPRARGVLLGAGWEPVGAAPRCRGTESRQSATPFGSGMCGVLKVSVLQGNTRGAAKMMK